MSWQAAAGGLVQAGLNYELTQQTNRQNKQMSREQMRKQEEAAKHGISWRVQDAMRAGLSPLVGAGASTTSLSPTAIGAVTPDLSGISEAGQNVGRAMMSSQDSATKKVTEQINQLSLERAKLQNELLKSQITKINSSLQPGTPTTGVETVASEQTASLRSDPSLEAATKSPGWKAFQTSPEGSMLLPSEKLKQSVEDSPYETQLFVTDYLKKLAGLRRHPDRNLSFNPLTGEYTKRSGFEEALANFFASMITNDPKYRVRGKRR